MWTATAPIVTVIPGSDDISVFGGLLALSPELQLSSIGTGVLVLLRVVCHVLNRIWVGLVLSRLILVGVCFDLGSVHKQITGSPALNS